MGGVLTKEQVAEVPSCPIDSFTRARVETLCDSHEALRAERDAALAQVERMRPVVEAAAGWAEYRSYARLTMMQEAVAAYRAAQPEGGSNA